ncbi:MAG: mobile mystery protein B [Gemmatimonadetes bacterium]|nr:mobile mystery protein B [Gemmatimonadota bacterium]
MSDKETDGATPVDPEEAEALLPKHIRSRAELNLWEQANILEAAKWVRRARAPALSDATIREVHRRMFDETWEWAGRYRTSDKTIGVYWATIPTEVKNLVDDGRYWLDKGTYPVDEAAARLHHRLVKIHPFPNGNGRHARLWCDMLLRQQGRPAFEWRNRELDAQGEARTAYIAALRAADGHDYGPLLGLLLRDRT